jgi:hypothetical protein
MNNRLWIALALTYVLLVSIEVLASYLLGHILLQMPLRDVYIITALLILAVTLGLVIAIMYFAKRKKK